MERVWRESQGIVPEERLSLKRGPFVEEKYSSRTRTPFEEMRSRRRPFLKKNASLQEERPSSNGAGVLE